MAFRPSRSHYERVSREIAKRRELERDLTVPSRVERSLPPCSIRREQEELVCVTCRIRWGVDEERPECPNI